MVVSDRDRSYDHNVCVLNDANSEFTFSIEAVEIPYLSIASDIFVS